MASAKIAPMAFHRSALISAPGRRGVIRNEASGSENNDR
jgi:hypothetical protein